MPSNESVIGWVHPGREKAESEAERNGFQLDVLTEPDGNTGNFHQEQEKQNDHNRTKNPVEKAGQLHTDEEIDLEQLNLELDLILTKLLREAQESDHEMRPIESEVTETKSVNEQASEQMADLTAIHSPVYHALEKFRLISQILEKNPLHEKGTDKEIQKNAMTTDPVSLLKKMQKTKETVKEMTKQIRHYQSLKKECKDTGISTEIDKTLTQVLKSVEKKKEIPLTLKEIQSFTQKVVKGEKEVPEQKTDTKSKEEHKQTPELDLSVKLAVKEHESYVKVSDKPLENAEDKELREKYSQNIDNPKAFGHDEYDKDEKLVSNKKTSDDDDKKDSSDDTDAKLSALVSILGTNKR